MLTTITGGQTALYLIGGALAALVVFAGWCMIAGWGVSIAVRSYRWCMRHHQPTPVVARRTKTVTLPEGGLDRYQASQVSSR
jgi:hypothetical protein